MTAINILVNLLLMGGTQSLQVSGPDELRRGSLMSSRARDVGTAILNSVLWRRLQKGKRRHSLYIDRIGCVQFAPTGCTQSTQKCEMVNSAVGRFFFFFQSTFPNCFYCRISHIVSLLVFFFFFFFFFNS